MGECCPIPDGQKVSCGPGGTEEGNSRVCTSLLIGSGQMDRTQRGCSEVGQLDAGNEKDPQLYVNNEGYFFLIKLLHFHYVRYGGGGK